ncbi:MAG: hypothetical protein HYZ26_13975 [Chloroflexi bacterium]|nr:hypothetical protein [Chloroflexota bacterium]
MSKSNVFRIIVLLAIVAGSLSLGATPAAAGHLFPPEWQDPEYVCEDLFLDDTFSLGGTACVVLFDFSYVANGNFLGGGVRVLYAEIWAEHGCSPEQGLLVELQKVFVGDDWAYVDFKVIGCYDFAGAEGRIGDAARGDDGSGTLSLRQPRNGMMNYDAGTCSGNCRITPNLPHGAAADLGTIPGGADATLYVNLGGGTGSYTVCFYGEGTIYQYISGLWQAIATSIGGGKSCASASGDGSFAFSEN